MPGEEAALSALGRGTEVTTEDLRRLLVAGLFLGAVTQGYDAFSAVNSSPWTSENFGADPQKAASSREYVAHAVGMSVVMGVASSIIGRTWWPVIGVVAIDGYMAWLYMRALRRAQDSGSTNWENAPSQLQGRRS